jgi:methyl-accepting chemotaxis protein
MTDMGAGPPTASYPQSAESSDSSSGGSAQIERWRPSALGVRGRLAAVVLVLGALALTCIGVAAAGMLSTRSLANRASAVSRAYRVERDAYEGWLTTDDQSNDFMVVANLRDPNAVVPGVTPRQTQAQFLVALWQQIEQAHQQAVSGLVTLARSAPEASVRRTAARAEPAEARFNYFTNEFHQAAVAGNLARASWVVTIGNSNISNVVQNDFNGMGAALTRYATKLDASVGPHVSNALRMVAVIGLIAIVIAVLIALWLLRSITRPLARVTAAAQRLAAGDVGVIVDIKSNDEIGQMARAFQRLVDYREEMAGAARSIAGGDLSATIEPKSEADVLGVAFADMRQRIADLLGKISASSRTVGAASQQIAKSGEQTGMAVGEIAHAVGSVAQGAEIQVRSLAQAREVTEEVATASQTSAVDAQETATAARQTRAVAEEGAAAVQRATEVMRAVQESSGEITRTIHELGATSQQIGGILDTITAVTKQTNLLALNAAIEAARAGEQGRGFAVVADQVRELAEQSQQAAATIGGLIAQIQAETGTAVKVVVEGARQTEEGVTTVAQAREAFLRIDASVEDMNGRVERIASAIEQIASSGARMQASVDEVLAVAEQSSASAQQVSATAENTSASTQQIAASAKALAGTAEELELLVSHFTLV